MLEVVPLEGAPHLEEEPMLAAVLEMEEVPLLESEVPSSGSSLKMHLISH